VFKIIKLITFNNLYYVCYIKYVGSITEFIIGLGIFLGSQGLVNFLNNLRGAGLKREDIDEESDS